MSCPCDVTQFPLPLTVRPGLTQIPRQIATFAEFRQAMLAAIRTKSPLTDWRARSDQDLGVMLLDMWAYVCDAVSFYDEVIAHESYLRTARRRPSLRKLIESLGYIPRPAIAALAKLAVQAEGRQPVVLPVGTGFRSGAFGSEAPQVFELGAEATVHPFLNSWTASGQPPSAFGSSATSRTRLLVDPGTSQLKKGQWVLIEPGDKSAVRRQISALKEITGSDGAKYLEVTFSSGVNVASVAPEDIKISLPSQTGSLWTMSDLSSNPDVITTRRIVMDGLYRQIKKGQFLFLERDDEVRLFTVTSAVDLMMNVSDAKTIEVTDADGNEASAAVPAVQVAATRFRLDPTNPWSSAAPSEIIVHYAFSSAADVKLERSSTVDVTGTFALEGTIEQPQTAVGSSGFLVRDRNLNGFELSATVDYNSRSLVVDADSGATGLVAPATIFGNVVTAFRGETVTGEILGSGDAALASQSFTLKKKPLTYLTAPGTVSGVASTLEIWVDKIRWTEVPTFYGQPPDAQVYIVRQDDEDNSIVTFGDGVRGSRVPSGINNIVANYRFGAGAAAPPANSITQLARPVKGLRSVVQPVAAFGGADREDGDNLRIYAPRSALVLGRVVSMADMEAVAASVAGVRAVSAEWRWVQNKQSALAAIAYVGDTGLEPIVAQSIRALTDPSTPIFVEAATPVPVDLAISIETEERYETQAVLDAVRTRLMDTTTGLLAPERVGIGKPLYRSRIFEAVQSVEGVSAVTEILWNGRAMRQFARTPGTGRYFDFEIGSVTLNGSGGSNG